MLTAKTPRCPFSAALLLQKIALCPTVATCPRRSGQPTFLANTDSQGDLKAQRTCFKVEPALWCNSHSRALPGIRLYHTSAETISWLSTFHCPILLLLLPLFLRATLNYLHVPGGSLSQALLWGMQPKTPQTHCDLWADLMHP